MNIPTKPLDPREMRKQILELAYKGIPLGKSELDFHQLSYASNIAGRVLRQAEAEGFSGEDAMTALAYFALMQVDSLFSEKLKEHNSRPNPLSFLMEAKS